MVKAQGWFALLWAPLGFIIGLFVTARIALPILLGLPRAIQLVSSGEMRAAPEAYPTEDQLFPLRLNAMHTKRVVLFCAIFLVANYRKSKQGKRHDYEKNYA